MPINEFVSPPNIRNEILAIPNKRELNDAPVGNLNMLPRKPNKTRKPGGMYHIRHKVYTTVRTNSNPSESVISPSCTHNKVRTQRGLQSIYDLSCRDTSGSVAAISHPTEDVGNLSGVGVLLVVDSGVPLVLLLLPCRRCDAGWEDC